MMPTRREWTIAGVPREALVAAPPQAAARPTPVVFVFHGHGSTMAAAATAGWHTLWPEALVVYPQGINTPGRLGDPEGKQTGWQSAAAQVGDRDLFFFDAMLATLRQEYRVDDARIYATGHSNGGFFTYLLWATRGAQLTAVAPTAAFADTTLPPLQPKPVLHLAGENDSPVKFIWQQATMDRLRELNQCEPGQPWDGEPFCTWYPSKLGAPVVTYIHPGHHEFPAGAAATITKFFQRHPPA